MRIGRKGFTLTEVLTVIILISLVVAIAVPSVISINKRINKRLLEGKKEVILAAAELYGKDNNQRFMDNEFIITVGELIEEGYLDVDTEKNNSNCSDDYGCVINPVDKTSLNNVNILVKQNVFSVVAVWDGVLGSTSSEVLVELVKDNLDCDVITEANPCLYTGDDVDNYLWYSGIMWRVMGVYKIDNKEVVKMITDDNVSFEVETSS